MTVSGFVALAGAVVGVTAIRAKGKQSTLEAAEAAVSPGGSAVAARETVTTGEPAADVIVPS
jgi:hypothetical protein